MSPSNPGAVTRWWWVRHAPVTCHDGRVYGQNDLPCDVSDVLSFEGLARLLPQDAVWVTSSLQRTHLTARAIVRAGLAGPDPIPGPDVIVEHALAEQHFGEWQGLKYAELPVANHPFWIAPAHMAPPGGESFADLVQRVTTTIRGLTERFAGRDIIAVTHGGTIRAAIGEALGLDPERALAVNIDNLSMTRLDHVAGSGTGHAWRVVTINRRPR